MLVHLSHSSPYVCDLNRGLIEQANRMASAPTKKATALLEQKESFPKPTRTPLKLLAPDEVPMDSTATATDINASLQPIWYSEQTIVDDHHVQQEDIASIIQEQQQQGKSPIPRTTLTRSILPPIQSESPSIIDEEEEEEGLPNQPSLMHKSSTFTIEPLNDSEKENNIKEDQINPPSDDSFRALEHLLGLGSTTNVRESPKTNHDTLSLTVVTPTDIINSTTTSLRMSYAPKNGSDSLPSSQDIPTMPTIESINSTNPPSFLIDNTTMEEEQASTATAAINQQTSFDITDNDTMKDDTNNDDETNFSFELNDFPDNSKNESTVDVSAPPPPMITIRAPTCADVAYRALIKPRTGGRVSQPVKADSPLANTNKLRSSAPTSRILRSICRRISTDFPSQNSMNQEQSSSNTECFINETNTNNVPQMELMEVINLPGEDENEEEKTTFIRLNLSSPKVIEETNQNASIQSEKISTPMKQIMPILSREYTYNTPKSRSSERRRSMLNSSRATLIQQQTTINEEESNSSSMLGILLTKPTETEPSVLQKTLTAPSSVRTSTRKTKNSPSIASKSMLEVLLTKPTEAETSVLQKTLTVPSPVRTSTRRAKHSSSIASKSMLEILLTKPTEAEPNVLQKTLTVPSPVRTSTRRTTNSPSIASKSMLEVLLTKPTETGTSVLQKTVTVPSPVRTSTRRTKNSPSIASKSMLEVLLTKPTEAEPSVLQKTLTVPSPVRTSTRKSERASSNLTPRVSINPLHSSTPSSSSRHKSLQIVSIGEEEQVSTIVPQQINNEIIQEEQPQEIEIIPLNDTEESIQQSSTLHTIEIGVQTTPSLDISSRRRLNILEQQTTPIVQMNKSSSMVIVNEEKQITPLQTKIIMNLQRNVRFQLTPSTDARLVAKEKFEENLRGLKPDIIINPTPIIPQINQENVKPIKSVPIKKTTKPKKKVITSRKKKAAAPKQTQPKQQQPIAKKPRQPRKASQKAKPIPPTKESKTESEVIPPTKRIQRKQPTAAVTAPTRQSKTESEVIPPTKRTQRKQPTSAVTAPTKESNTKLEVISPIKRTQRKRVIPEVTPPMERASRKRIIPEVTTNPIEPVVKRAKTSKSVEVLPSKTRNSSIDHKKSIPEPIERQTRTRSRSTNNKTIISEPITKIEPKNITPTMKTSKRRLQSVEKNEGIKKKVEEEKIQSIPPVRNFELTQEEQQKIEALTVAGLKSRLNTHEADIPKGAKKADLIALLIKIETNLLKERKQTETATVTTTTMTTRRRKK